MRLPGIITPCRQGLAALGVVLVFVAGSAAGGEPSCLRCHPLLPPGHQVGVPAEALSCLNCHDGHGLARSDPGTGVAEAARARPTWRSSDRFGLGMVLAGLAGLAVHGLLYGLTRRKRLPPADSGLAAQNLFPPLAVRWWHALNAATVLLLLATGFLLRFFAAGGAVWARPARMLHGGAGLLLTSIWLFWLMYSALRRRVLCRDGALCRPDPVRGIRRQLGYYAWGVFHGHADPHARTARDPLNPLQKLVYLVVMGALMPLIIMTGLALLKMFRMFAGGWTLAVLDGHMISGCLLLLFLCMHLYLAAWGPSARPRLRPGRAEGGD